MLSVMAYSCVDMDVDEKCEVEISFKSEIQRVTLLAVAADTLRGYTCYFESSYYMVNT